MTLGISIHFQRLSMCLQQSQLTSIRAFGGQVQVWQQRGTYAALRPNGWRSQPDSKTSPRSAMKVQRACSLLLLQSYISCVLLLLQVLN